MNTVSSSKPGLPGMSRYFNRQNMILAAVVIVLLIVGVVGLRQVYPVGVDWFETFDNLPENWRDPYAVPTFVSPPWVTAFVPHGLLPIEWGNAVNFMLNLLVLMLVIMRYRGGWQAMLLTFTSPMMLDLARTNNIDWVPLLAFLVPHQWGLLLLISKPQVLGGAALIWWKRQKFALRMLIPSIVLVVVSLLVWGLWFQNMQLPEQSHWWNFAPFPLGIPFGLYILYQAWKKDDEILGAVATPFLVPYFAPYSLPGVMALLASRYPRAAFFLYFGFWWYTVVSLRRV